MDNLEKMLLGLLCNNYATADKVGRDVVGEYIIDTCDTVDCGWETAVWKSDNPDNMVIVARYHNKDEASAGHSEWVKYCAKHKPTEVLSVQTDVYEPL